MRAICGKSENEFDGGRDGSHQQERIGWREKSKDHVSSIALSEFEDFYHLGEIKQL